MLQALALIPLSFASYTDYKERLIPNWTWIVIVIIALFQKNMIQNIFPAILLFAVMLMIAYFFNGFGGGDIKLAGALGLLMGEGVYIVMLITCILALLTNIKKKHNIPVAVYIIIGYISVMVLNYLNINI